MKTIVWKKKKYSVMDEIDGMLLLISEYGEHKIVHVSSLVRKR